MTSRSKLLPWLNGEYEHDEDFENVARRSNGDRLCRSFKRSEYIHNTAKGLGDSEFAQDRQYDFGAWHSCQQAYWNENSKFEQG